jgi:hypothetical protein
MKKVLLWLWQLPQNLLGLILTLNFKECMEDYYFNDLTVGAVYFKPLFRSGVSLGDYIILDSEYLHYLTIIGETLNHEHGHQKQSRILGPLYLIVIGIPSMLGNIYSRIFNKDSEWYYKQPWEAWADKLGGVIR